MGCVHPIDNYNGDVVYERGSNGYGKYVLLKYKTKEGNYGFRRVYVEDVDFERYQVLDTIK